METDYSTLTMADFDREVKKYVVFRLVNEDSLGEELE
jgi:hypothetical protein